MGRMLRDEYSLWHLSQAEAIGRERGHRGNQDWNARMLYLISPTHRGLSCCLPGCGRGGPSPTYQVRCGRTKPEDRRRAIGSTWAVLTDPQAYFLHTQSNKMPPCLSVLSRPQLSLDLRDLKVCSPIPCLKAGSYLGRGSQPASGCQCGPGELRLGERVCGRKTYGTLWVKAGLYGEDRNKWNSFFFYVFSTDISFTW